MKKQFLLISIVTLLLGCSITKNQNKGNVVPENFNYQTKFETIKSVMILPVEINGISKNFIFDTGANYSLIQRSSTLGKTSNIQGASKRKMKLGNEMISSMKIGNVDFINTFALNGDMKGLKEQIPNFGGLIGQPIIKKANWLIDYPNKLVNISNKNLTDTSFETIEITRKGGSPYTYISINGIKHKVIIDLGSSSELNVPRDSKLAKQLLNQYSFSDNEKEVYTLGGIQKMKEKVGIIPLVKLGNMDFKNVNMRIAVTSEPRIGISFFKDCKIYIDNFNSNYKIKK